MNDVKKILSDINAFLKSMPWCDFQILEMRGDRLVLEGSLSESYPFDIRITFEETFHVQCNTSWKTDTGSDVIVEVEGDEAREINLPYRIEIGNFVFKILPEDISRPFYVAARSISYLINKDGDDGTAGLPAGAADF